MDQIISLAIAGIVIAENTWRAIAVLQGLLG